MSHKTMIDGVAYEISGGKTLIDGTAYSIKNGKTLVDGTAYEIRWNPKIIYSRSGITWGYSITIDGNEIALGTNSLPVGTVIELSVTTNGSNPASSIILNGNVVAEKTNGTATYSYTVTTDATIHLQMNGGAINHNGTITITES